VHTMKKVLTVLFIVFVFALEVGCGGGAKWANTGGGVSSYNVSSLTYDSVHNVLYAGCTDDLHGYLLNGTLTHPGGVWKYDGTRWTKIGEPKRGDRIVSLAYDSKHDVLYAGTGADVWKYDGVNWTNIHGATSSVYGAISFFLIYDSVHDLLYGAGPAGVAKYDGTDWTQISGAVSSPGSPTSLALDPVHNLLYAGTNGQGSVWRYDSGTTWTGIGQIGGNLPDSSVGSLACDPVHNLLYASGNHGVWKWDGAKWTDIGGEVSKYEAESLAYDSVRNVLYAGCSKSSSEGTPIGKGVWKYDGTSWKDTGEVSNYRINTMVYDSAHNLLYAGTYPMELHAERAGQTGHGVWKYTSAK